MNFENIQTGDSVRVCFYKNPMTRTGETSLLGKVVKVTKMRFDVVAYRNGEVAFWKTFRKSDGQAVKRLYSPTWIEPVE